ncbi:MAG: hypothetical protein FWF30_02660, partial [Coriobacteriia bacterium]|nr:hypothetical protein [Coriobacteriia bacterium]
YWDDALVDARISTGTTKLEDIYAELTRRDVGVLPFENLPDIHVPKSVGAKWASDTVNIEYDAGNGLTALTRIGELAEGSVIIGPKVIAGGEYGRIKDIDRIIEAYQGLPSEWLKLKGLGLVKFDEDDSIVEKELHWLQRGGKRYEIKIPRKKL